MPCNSRHVSRSYSKDETEKIAFEWQSLLVSAAKGGEPSTYVIEPGIILWSVQVRSLPIFRTITSMRTASSTAPSFCAPLTRTVVALRRSNVRHSIIFAVTTVTLLQDGAKGYDIIDFCFLRPEFHEVSASAAMSQPPSLVNRRSPLAPYRTAPLHLVLRWLS